MFKSLKMYEALIFLEMSILLCIILYSLYKVQKNIKEIKCTGNFYEFNVETEKIIRKDVFIIFQLFLIPFYIAFFLTILGKYVNISHSLRYFIILNLIIPYLASYFVFYDKIIIYNKSLVTFTPLFIKKRLELTDIIGITSISNRDNINGIYKYLYVPEKTIVLELKNKRSFYICVKEIDDFIQLVKNINIARSTMGQ